MEGAKYDKGGSAGSKGVDYQVNLLTVVFLKAMEKKLKDWRLSTENKNAGKFDDIVMETNQGDVLLQAKFKENNKRITLEDLLSPNSRNDDFSLPKYFLSYQKIKNNFKTSKLIICTTAKVNEKALKFINLQKICAGSILYDDTSSQFGTFDNTILPRLKEAVNSYYHKSQNKDVQETEITDENLIDFLGRLQFYFNYPSHGDLSKIIEQLLSSVKRCYSLDAQVTSIEINGKVMDWFQQKNGVYLTEMFGMKMFSEIWRDKHWQELEQYKITFRNCLHFQNSSKQIIHVIADTGYLLQEMQIYSALHRNKDVVLYINPDDGVEVQKLLLEAFRLPQFSFLVIVAAKITEESLVKQIQLKLKEALDKHHYKKVIFVAGASKCTQMFQIVDMDCDIIDDCAKFESLSLETQEMLKRKKHIIFQGKNISLGDLLANQSQDDYQDLLSSEVLEQLVKGECIKVGSKLFDLDENTARYYVNRTLRRDKKVEGNSNSLVTEETFSEEDILEVNEKLILISDSAGMGKSTILTKLATAIKNKNPHLWVIRIELNDYTTIFRTMLRNKKKEVNIVDLLAGKDTTKLSNEFEKSVFEKLHNKVVLMLDGVDEISPDYTDLVKSLLTQCYGSNNVAKIFVTTRPHVTQELGTQLNNKSFKLQPFTQCNQIDFLVNYWSHTLKLNEVNKEKCKTYSETLVGSMTSWKLNPMGNISIIAIPLQMRMLAEIFQENNAGDESKNWQGCKEYVEEVGIEPRLPININFTELYEMFVEAKRNIFIDKGNPIGNIFANEALVEQFDENLKYHKTLALETILRKKQYQCFSLYKKQELSKNAESQMLKIGIVQKFSDEFHFVHRTFAEYFLAQCLLAEIQIPNHSENFQKFFIEDFLWNAEFKVTRSFFGNFLLRIVDQLPPNTLIDYLEQEINWEVGLNLIHQLAKEGCVAVLQLILKCIDFKRSGTKHGDIDKFYSSIDRKQVGGTLNILQLLVEQCGVNIRDANGTTPLLLAVRGGHLEASKFLVERGANIKAKDVLGYTVFYEAVNRNHVDIAEYLLKIILTEDSRHQMVAFAAAYLGRCEILKGLTKRVLDVVVKGQTLIFAAVHGNQLNTIQFLIHMGADINKRDENGYTPLHLATDKSRLDTVKHLVECGANVHLKCRLGRTPLHLAALLGRLDIVTLLVERDADVNSVDGVGYTALHWATAMGHLEMVKYLFMSGTDVKIKDYAGHSALFEAIRTEELAVAKFLLLHDQNINDKGRSGDTVLQAIIGYRSLKAVKFLVEHNVDGSIKDNKERTALYKAAHVKEWDTVRILARAGADANAGDATGCTALHLAARMDELETVECLLECGANINARDNAGRTALHKIARIVGLKTFKSLVEHKADVNIIDNAGRTPLHLAVAASAEHVRNLLEHGADVNVTDEAGCTPLHLAAEETQDIVTLLTEHGADVNIRDSRFRTALHQAAEMGKNDIVACLVEQGADVKAKDCSGRTIVHEAVEMRKWEHVSGSSASDNVTIPDNWLSASEFSIRETVKLLLSNGASINERDNNGVRVLHLASRTSPLATVQFLVNSGAAVNVTDNAGRTPLHLAARLGRLGNVKFLVESGAEVNVRDDAERTPLHEAAAMEQLDTAEYLLKCGADIEAKDLSGCSPLDLAPGASLELKNMARNVKIKKHRTAFVAKVKKLKSENCFVQ